MFILNINVGTNKHLNCKLRQPAFKSDWKGGGREDKVNAVFNGEVKEPVMECGVWSYHTDSDGMTR